MGIDGVKQALPTILGVEIEWAAQKLDLKCEDDKVK